MKTSLLSFVIVPVVVVAAGVAWLRPAGGAAAPLERGRYLVEAFGCADCHTPFRMGTAGPEPDPTLRLAGHPEALVVTQPPRMEPGPWIVAATGTNTAWAGPWGVSFSANLTADPDTGLGRWTEAMFLDAVRSGRHLGSGRPILPPMPTAPLARLTDGDLRAVFAYLQTVPGIRNRVPEPLPPSGRP